MKFKILSSTFILSLLITNAMVLANPEDEEEETTSSHKISVKSSEGVKNQEETPEYIVKERPFDIFPVRDFKKSENKYTLSVKYDADKWEVSTNMDNSTHLLESASFPTDGVTQIEFFYKLKLKLGGITVGMVKKDSEWLKDEDEKVCKTYLTLDNAPPFVVNDVLVYEFPGGNLEKEIFFVIASYLSGYEKAHFEVHDLKFRITYLKSKLEAIAWKNEEESWELIPTTSEEPEKPPQKTSSKTWSSWGWGSSSSSSSSSSI